MYASSSVLRAALSAARSRGEAGTCKTSGVIALETLAATSASARGVLSVRACPDFVAAEEGVTGVAADPLELTQLSTSSTDPAAARNPSNVHGRERVFIDVPHPKRSISLIATLARNCATLVCHAVIPALVASQLPELSQ